MVPTLFRQVDIKVALIPNGVAIVEELIKLGIEVTGHAYVCCIRVAIFEQLIFIFRQPRGRPTPEETARCSSLHGVNQKLPAPIEAKHLSRVYPAHDMLTRPRGVNGEHLKRRLIRVLRRKYRPAKERDEDNESQGLRSIKEHIRFRIIFLVRWTALFNAIRGTKVSMNLACIICFD